jgi:NADPH:quinone reductase-like Zn-dependent oxidoreductase
MLAVRATSANFDNPLDALSVSDVPDVDIADAAPADWVPVTLKATALNQHDVWSLRGVGLAAEKLPMVIGCDGAGVTDEGTEVLVHAVITSSDWTRPETLDPKRSILSEAYNGTLADRVWIPRANLVPKPIELSFEEAACLPVAWLTAFSMLTAKAQVVAGDTVLVQGAGGGVSTAAISIAKALGLQVFVTSRAAERRARALELGADEVFEPGARLPHRVDAVIESVGKATWAHSLRALRPGGTIVVCGATSGDAPLELNRVFFQQLRIVGSTMGSREELAAVARLCVDTGVRPTIDSIRPLSEARSAFERLIAGDAFGKLVLTL